MNSAMHHINYKQPKLKVGKHPVEYDYDICTMHNRPMQLHFTCEVGIQVELYFSVCVSLIIFIGIIDLSVCVSDKNPGESYTPSVYLSICLYHYII